MVSDEKGPSVEEAIFADLNERRRAFVVAYTGNHFGNATRSYMAAYGVEDEAVARSAACRLVAIVSVRSAIDALLSVSDKILSSAQILESFSDLARSSETDPRIRVRALENLAKVAGLYVQKIEHSGASAIVAVAQVPAFVEDPKDFARMVEQERALARAKQGK